MSEALAGRTSKQAIATLAAICNSLFIDTPRDDLTPIIDRLTL
jgi:hypothetical protein